MKNIIDKVINDRNIIQWILFSRATVSFHVNKLDFKMFMSSSSDWTKGDFTLINIGGKYINKSIKI